MIHFGLDIGTNGLRLIELEKKKGKYCLLAIASSKFSGWGLMSEAEKDHQELAEAIKKMVAESKVDTRQVVVGLPEAKVFSRLIEVPVLTDEELSSSLAWEAEQYIPVPLDEVNLDWEVVSRPAKGEKEETMKVFLVAAPINLVEKYTKILKLAGLTPVALETEIIAAVRSLLANKKSPALLIDFGASATDIAAVREGKIVLTRSIPIGGIAFTRALGSVLNLSEEKAEEYKKTYGVKEELEGKIKTALTPLLEAVVAEIKKSIDFYSSEQKGFPLSLIILAGGTAKMPEVANLLTEKLGLEVQIADPFADLIKDDLIKNFLVDAPLFSVAMGLAMKEV